MVSNHRWIPLGLLGLFVVIVEFLCVLVVIAYPRFRDTLFNWVTGVMRVMSDGSDGSD